MKPIYRLKTCLLLWACCSAAGNSIHAQPVLDLPSGLLGQSEMIPDWQKTRGSFVLSARGFILCRGLEFQSDPPVTAGMRWNDAGKTWDSLGMLNNDIMKSIEAISIDQKDTIKQATRRLENALQVDNEFWPLLYNLGRLHLVLKQYHEANRFLERALQLMPEYSRSHFYLGLVNGKFRRGVAVKYHFAQATKLNPDDPAAATAMGDYFVSLGSLSHAQSIYTKIKRKHPQSSQGTLGLVRIDLGKKEYVKARRRILDWIALRKIEDNWQPEKEILMLYYLSELHYQLKDYKRAKSNFEFLLNNPADELFLYVSPQSIQKRLKIISRKFENK